jgi:hypothetical protein
VQGPFPQSVTAQQERRFHATLDECGDVRNGGAAYRRPTRQRQRQRRRNGIGLVQAVSAGRISVATWPGASIDACTARAASAPTVSALAEE